MTVHLNPPLLPRLPGLPGSDRADHKHGKGDHGDGPGIDGPDIDGPGGRDGDRGRIDLPSPGEVLKTPGEIIDNVHKTLFGDHGASNPTTNPASQSSTAQFGNATATSQSQAPFSNPLGTNFPQSPASLPSPGLAERALGTVATVLQTALGGTARAADGVMGSAQNLAATTTSAPTQYADALTQGVPVSSPATRLDAAGMPVANPAAMAATPAPIANPAAVPPSLSGTPQSLPAQVTMPAPPPPPARQDLPLPGRAETTGTTNTTGMPGMTADRAAATTTTVAPGTPMASTTATLAQAAPLLGATAPLAVPLSQAPPGAVGDVRVGTLAASDRAGASRADIPTTGVYTADGPLRKPLDRSMKALPGTLTRWLAALGLTGAVLTQAEPDPQRDRWFALQWLFWMLAIVAYGCLALALVVMVPGGDGMFDETRSSAGTYALTIGLVASLGAWWSARQLMRK